MIATWIVSLLLIGLSGWMLDWHRRSWRKAAFDASISNSERRYALSQYRRRMQASSIIGVLGVAIALGPIVPRRPWPMMIYLISVAAACLAITFLAAIDAWATRQYFARLRSQNLAAQVQLARELRTEQSRQQKSNAAKRNLPSSLSEGESTHRC
jgi:hypothetical protein